MATVSDIGQARPQRRAQLYWGALIVLGVVGLVIWGTQLTGGMDHTGLNQDVVWGLYIAGFFVAAGSGAGVLFLVGIMQFRPELRAEAWPRLPAVALGSFVAAGILIAMDLGSPARVWRIAFAGEWSSPMVWDFWLLLATTIVAAVYWWRLRSARGEDTSLRPLAVVGMVLAVALVVAESLLLVQLAAREWWAGGLTVISFLVAAGIGGLALYLLTTPKLASAQVITWLQIALAASLVIVLAEVIAGAMSSNTRTREQINLLVTGAEAPLFWLHIIGGLVLPLALLSWKPNAIAISAAAVLAIFGVLLEKVWLLAIGQAFPWVSLPSADYLPTWSEVLGALGAMALGGLVYLLLDQAIRPRR